MGDSAQDDPRADGRAGVKPLIVLDAVTEFLDDRGIGHGPVLAAPIGDGHSNITYLVQRDDVKVVLRRPPRPPLPPSTHDVVREAQIIAAVRTAGVRVPTVLAVCEDPSVLDVPFYVMEYVEGVVVAEHLSPALASPEARARLAHDLVDALVELHGVDHGADGLATIGRPTGYLARQIRRFSSLWTQVRTRDVREIERVAAWLTDNMPATSETSLVHGDYRLGNVLVDRERPRVLAILDWEMATLGDPLADLGYLCATWAQDDEAANVMTQLSAATTAPGFPRSSELADRYARASGRDTRNLRFYEVLALFKAAVFLESSHRRFIDGRTDDPYFAKLAVGVPQLAREALARTKTRDL